MSYLLFTIYVIGLIIGYVVVLYLQANKKIGSRDDFGSDRGLIIFLLYIWPISIPLLIAGVIIFAPIYWVGQRLLKVEEKILEFFKRGK